MTKCTVFSIFEREVQNFIYSLQWQLYSTNELREWFYEKGLNIGLQAVDASHQDHLNQHKKKFSHYPDISTPYIIGQFFIALSAIRVALKETFKRVPAELIEHNFNIYLLSAIGEHTVFMKALAEVLNDCYALLDKNNALSNAEMDQNFITLLKVKQEQYPCDKYPIEATDFKNHLTFVEELSAQRPKPNPHQLFTIPAAPVQASSVPVND